MLVQCDQMVCTAKPAPRKWEMQRRDGSKMEGVSFPVTFSDGETNMDFKCCDGGVYESIKPFGSYLLDLDIVQKTNDNGRKRFDVVVVSASPID